MQNKRSALACEFCIAQLAISGYIRELSARLIVCTWGVALARHVLRSSPVVPGCIVKWARASRRVRALEQVLQDNYSAAQVSEPCFDSGRAGLVE